MCCHDIRQATKTSNEKNIIPKPKGLVCLVQQGNRALSAIIYIHIYIYLSLYIWVDVRVHHHGFFTLQRSCITLCGQILGHAPGGRYPVYKWDTKDSGRQGCWLSGLYASSPPLPATPQPPRSVSHPLQASSAFSLHPSVSL